MTKFTIIVTEMKKHAPFTALGAITGIAVMAIIVLLDIPRETSNAIFYTLHPIHVVFSAMATTAMFKLHGKNKVWIAIIIGYTGSIGIATISDVIIPYIGATLLNIPMEFHFPVIETSAMPYIGIPKWQVVNASAALGILIGYLMPRTKTPHFGHVLLSTWASLFSFTAFGIANWIPILHLIFLFLFFAVWIPCCVSDIAYPLIFAKRN